MTRQVSLGKRSENAGPAKGISAGTSLRLTDAFRDWRRDAGGRVVIALAAYVFVYALWTVFHFGGGSHTDLINGLAFQPVMIIGAIYAWRAASQPALDRRTAWAWIVICLAFLAYWAGDGLWFYYESVLDQQPFPSWADAGYLAFYPIMLAGLLLFPVSPRTSRERLKLFLDGAIVAVAATLVIWYALLRPIANEGGAEPLEKVLSLAYPVGDLVLIYGVIALLFRRPRASSRGALEIFVSGLALFVLADTLFAYLSLSGSFESATPLDATWVIGELVMVVAAHYQYWSAGRIESEVEEAGRPRTLVVAPYIAAASTYLLLIYAFFFGFPRDEFPLSVGILVLGASLTSALALARQLAALRENEHLLAKTATLTNDIRRSEGRFRSLVQNTADVIVLLDVQGNVSYISPAVEHMLGYPPETRLGTGGLSFVHPEDTDVAQAALARLMTDAGETTKAELRLLHANGSWRWVDATGTNLLHDPNVEAIVVTYSDVTDRKLLADELAEQAFRDSLTGLANRSLLLDRLNHAIVRAERECESLAVLLLDVDDFKTINDSLGHSAGDEVLVTLAARISNTIRKGDTAARPGGDEFAILLEDADTMDAARTAERILEALRAPIQVQGRDVFAYASMGIALHHIGDDGADELLRNADVAMYTAKSRGKGRYEVYDPEMHLAAVSRLEMKADLERALEQGEFVLYYQPIIDLPTDDIAGFEALLRWNHPHRGLVAPVEFIPLAEETGLIVPIGRWVIEEAAKTTRDWQRKFEGRESLEISVNLSPKQLQESSLLLDVGRGLLQSDLRADALVLEITENALMQDTESNIRKLQHLKSLGVRVAIDDFGTGYSSLGYLQRFQVDILKIDKQFVDHIHDSPEDSAVARTIIDLGHALNLVTIAEGVEEEVQAARLREMGCDCAQGYHFARPLSVADAERLLKGKGRSHLNAASKVC